MADRLAEIDPEHAGDEASPQRLAEVATQAEAGGATTVFFEELVSPKVAESLARKAGATAAVLSPLEGPPERGDHLSAMRDNLERLRTALDCTGPWSWRCAARRSRTRAAPPCRTWTSRYGGARSSPFGLLLVSALMVVPVATAQQLVAASAPPSSCR